MTDEVSSAVTEAAPEAPVAEITPIEPVVAAPVAEITPIEPVVAAPAPAALVVPANPALIDWPSDIWGSVSELRSALIDAARRVRGDAVKLEVFTSTVRVGILHALARFDTDKAALQAELDELHAANEARAGRVVAEAVPND